MQAAITPSRVAQPGRSQARASRRRSVAVLAQRTVSVMDELGSGQEQATLGTCSLAMQQFVGLVNRSVRQAQ